MTPRTLARSSAFVAALALVVGPLAGAASAAPKRKPPTPVITAKPASPTNVRTATFSFTNTQAGVTFECSLDGAAYAACTSPHSYAGPLSAATHTFRVRAKDAAGTLSNFAQAQWVIDLTPPAAPSLSGVPSSPTSATSASLSFTTAEVGATFVCALDGATPATCTSPVALSSLTDGPHTFTVAVRDAASNVGPTTSGTWTVDTTPPPAPTITTGPADLTNATAATFQVFNGDADATLECSLDAATFAACPDPIAYVGLAEGVHTFVVRAVDALGNGAAAPTWTWEVDLTAPTPPAILTGPDAQTKDTVAVFTINGFDAVALLCSVDSGDYAACESPFSTDSLADGPHTLHVKGVDAAENESGATPYQWSVDNTPPPAAVVTGPAALTNATSATFTITNTEQLVTYTCALDGGGASSCESGVTFSSLADGAHELVVTASDQLGNTTPTTYDWAIDTAPPTASLTAPASLVAPIEVTFSEAVSGVSATSVVLRVSGSTTGLATALRCYDAGAVETACSGAAKSAELVPSVPLVPGQRYVVVLNPAGHATVADAAGNALAAAALPFRAQTSLDQTTPAAKWTWRVLPSSSSYGGSYRTEHLAGAAATYTFTGTSVTWYTIKGKSQGVADVYVDGVKKATVNNYSSTTTYKVARAVSGLPNAKHVLKIVVRGVKGSTSGTGTFVAVDAIKVGTTFLSSPGIVQAWRTSPAASASGGSLAVADLTGQEMSLRFRGTAISWYTSTGRNRGIAKVYVDGVLKATVDTYASATAYNVKKSVTGLTDALHTIRIVVTGTRRAASAGNVVAIDRFAIA